MFDGIELGKLVNINTYTRSFTVSSFPVLIFQRERTYTDCIMLKVIKLSNDRVYKLDVSYIYSVIEVYPNIPFRNRYL